MRVGYRDTRAFVPGWGPDWTMDCAIELGTVDFQEQAPGMVSNSMTRSAGKTSYQRERLECLAFGALLTAS